MSKTIYISHGDKGGCGKSFLAMYIASLFEMYEAPYLLVEADASQSGGQPDVAPRFENSKYGQVVRAPISGKGSAEDLIADLFEVVQQSDVEHVVINTPAGASEQLEQVGELVGMACQGLGYRLVIFYNLFKTDVAVEQAENILYGRLAEYADEFYFVKNDYFGIPDLSLAMQEIPSFTFPVLHKNVMDRLKSNQNLSDGIKEFPMMQKIQIEQFVKSMKQQGFLEVLQGA